MLGITVRRQNKVGRTRGAVLQEALLLEQRANIDGTYILAISSGVSDDMVVL